MHKIAEISQTTQFNCDNKFWRLNSKILLMKHKPQFLTPTHPKNQQTTFTSTSTTKYQQHQYQNFLMTNFQSDTKYFLNSINSILFSNILYYSGDGKIYNLLQRNLQKKNIKCGCIKSYCQAKYCQCFRNGQACGQQCNCRQCRNKKNRKNISPHQNIGCKCIKSGCSKKYCQCFQNGKKCGTLCQCSNCANGED